jgi:flagellar biosynthesis GTPase FlhF
VNDDGFRELIPGDNASALPPKSHNVIGGLRTEAELTAYLEESFSPVVERVDQLLAAEAKMPKVDGPEPESKATEYVKLIQACAKLADQTRLAEKGPYDLAANQVHQYFKKMIDSLDGLKKRVERQLTDYKVTVMRAEQAARAEEQRKARQAEQDRLAAAAAAQAAAEEAERRAAAARKPETKAAGAEAAAAARAVADTAARELEQASADRATAEQAASAKAAEMTRSRGKRGGVSSLMTFWNFRDLSRADLGKMADPRAMPPAIVHLLPHISTEALETAVRSYIKANQSVIENGGQPLFGVTFFQDHSTRVS